MELIIEGVKEIKILRVNTDFINMISTELPNIFSAASGATCIAGPISYLYSFKRINLNPREGEHVFKGVIYQKLKENIFVIGIVYFDHSRKAYREDIFTLHTDLMYIRKFTKSEFEKEYPEFRGFHTSQKDFFNINEN